MSRIKEHFLGRVLVLRWEGVLDGSGPTPQEVRQEALRHGARLLLLDTTASPYADTEGVRWLLRLRDELEASGQRLRIAARPQGKIWRILSLLQLGLEVFESAARAWKTPWRRSAPEGDGDRRRRRTRLARGLS